MVTLPPETEALAQKLADNHGLSVYEVIRRSLEIHAESPSTGFMLPNEKHSHSYTPKQQAQRRARLEQFVKNLKPLPLLDQRSPQEIMDDINEL